MRCNRVLNTARGRFTIGQKLQWKKMVPNEKATARENRRLL